MFTLHRPLLSAVVLPALLAAGTLALPAAASAADAPANARVTARAAAAPPAHSVPQDTFNPDYSHALSTGQMSAAWRAAVRTEFAPESVIVGNWGRE
jgi:hypothetical protein